MKSAYIVNYKHNLAGRAMVVASDMDEARREAVAYARFTTACIPDWYKTDDIVESIEPAGDIPLGAWGYGYRPTVQLETHDGFNRMTAKEAIACIQTPDFSKFDQKQATEAAV